MKDSFLFKYKHMKFLIIDDEEDIRDVIALMLQSNFDVQIFQAVDGENALEIIQTEGPFDLIFSDLNMPRKNGVEVYRELRKSNSTTPFILVTADNKVFKTHITAPIMCDYIEKPFTEEDLIQKTHSVFAQKEIPVQKESYIPINIELLKKVEYAGVSLFIKLNNTQFIKVLKDNVPFNASEYIRFKNKKVSHLYIELIDFKLFISQFRKNIFSQIDWNSVDIAPALENLETDWKLVIDANKHFGWSDSLADLAKENIARTLALIQKNEQLKKILDRNKNESRKSMTTYSYSAVFFTTALLKELGWSSPSTIQKMTFACLLHDIELTETMFNNKLELIKNDKLTSEIHQQMNYQIFQHPQTASEFVQRWSSCPSDVDKVILQHHEKFDGSGFPHKLNFLNIYPLAAVLILAEDLIFYSYFHPEENLFNHLQSRESYYNHGDIKKIYSAALKICKDIPN